MKRNLFTEDNLNRVIKESIDYIIERKTKYEYKNHDNRRKVAQHLKGKTPEQKRSEWSDIIAKRTAITDINRDRDWEHMSPHDREFSHGVNYDTFNINFDDLDDYDYIIDDTINEAINESYGEVRNSNNGNNGGLSVFGSDVKSNIYNRIKSFYNGLIKSCETFKESFSQNKIDDLDFYLKNILSKLNDLQFTLQDTGIRSLLINNIIKYFNRLNNEGIENIEYFATHELDEIVEMIGEELIEQMQ